MPEQHLSIDWCMKEAREARGFPHIVLNPRVTMLAQNAHLHLAIRPGADLALRNAMILEIERNTTKKLSIVSPYSETVPIAHRTETGPARGSREKWPPEKAALNHPSSTAGSSR